MYTQTEKVDLKSVRVLSAGHLVNDSYGGFIFPILPVLAAHLNVPLSLACLLTAVAGMSGSFMQPIFGYISDRLTKRFFIFWGLFFSFFFISLIGYANNYFVLMILLILGNLGVALYHPQATAMAGYFSGKEINKHMGFFTACGTIGYAAGPIVSSFLVGNFGLKSTIWAIIPGAIMTFLIYTMVPRISKDLNTIPVKKSWHYHLFNFEKVIYSLSFISLTRAIVIISFTILMPFLLKGYGTSLTGVIIALFSFFGGIGSYVGGKLSNVYGKRTTMMWSLIPATPILIGTLFFLKIVPVLSFILFVMAGFLLMSANSINIVIAQKAAPKNMAMVSGLIGGFCWGLAHLFQYPIGFISQIFGISQVLAIISFFPIIGIILTSRISREYE